MKNLLFIIMVTFLLIPMLGQSAEFRWENETGEEMSMSTLQGEPVVLHFWASWCLPCRSEMPALVNWIAQNPEVNVVMVSLDFNKESAVEFYAEQGIKTGLNMANKPDASRLGVRGLPATLLIGADGEVKKRYYGEVQWGDSAVTNELLN